MIKITFGKNLLITAMAGVISLLFIMRVFTNNYNKLIETRRINVDQAGEFISEQFKEEVVKNILALENLKGRLEETNGAYFENWEYEANIIREQSESIMFIEWIDSSMIVQRVNPYIGNERVLGLYIGDFENRATNWKEAIKDSITSITAWTELIQGSNAFLVDIPLYYGSTFQGSVSAAMDFNSIFDKILAERKEYFVTLSDQENTLFYQSRDSTGIDEYKNYLYTKAFSIFEEDENWTFTLQPNEWIIGRSLFNRVGIGLALGLTLSFSLTIAVFFILESKTAEKKLKILNKDLKLEKEKAEESSKVKTEFLSNMSHEIRTPLSAVMGLIEILKDEKDEENVREYLAMLETSSKNLLALVTDILDINKIESGSLELAETEFILNDEILKIYELNKPVFEEKGLYLKLDQSKLEEYKVSSDPSKLAQILGNLIRNAYKFTEKGGLEIQCSGERVHRHLKVNISLIDTGIGIPEDKKEYIFERFTQIDSGLDRKYEGSGLGLSITRKILHLMGGGISLKSIEGKGTQFEIEFSLPIVKPLTLESNKKGIVKDGKDFEEGFLGAKVLIVDDNELNLLVLEKVLTRYQVSVDKAVNGEEAVRKAVNNLYDIVFMDLHMPKKDGFEATLEIKAKGVETPIIIVSANVTSEAMTKAKEIGITDFVTKPFTSHKIYLLLSSYLNKSQ